jgi:hypothetical protein
MFKLSHQYRNQHNHSPTPNPFTLEPHRNRRPRRTKAIEITKKHRRVLSFAELKEILKKIRLEIDTKSYYNLRGKEESQMLNLYEKALYLLRELKNQNVYVAVKEKYVIDKEENKTDRIIKCIA